MNAREYLNRIVYKRDEIDGWLSGKLFPFSKYDQDLGYVHRSRRCKEGIDGSLCTYTYDSVTGARKLLNHADQPCRINTYGDSFTNCEQVNDGETWQETLAARIGEPIRNFGIGSQSVYQMYLRMKREESRVPADYIIMNIYCDDPFRSLIPWMRIRHNFWGMNSSAPPQPYVKANPATKEFREFKNPAPEPKDLYDFCDPGWVYDRFRDDFMLRVMLAKTNGEGGSPQDSYRDMEDLSAEFGAHAKVETREKLLEVANSLYTASAICGGTRLVEKTEEFVEEKGKRILFISSYANYTLESQISPGRPSPLPEFRKPGHGYNADFVAFMKKKQNRRYVDLMEEHLADFSRRKVETREYLGEFWVSAKDALSHYGPGGNQFTALSIRDKVVGMLEPKPPAYSPTLHNTDATCVSLD